MPTAGESPFLWLLSFGRLQKKVTRGAGRSARDLKVSGFRFQVAVSTTPSKNGLITRENSSGIA
jgi:hypothetical protein